MKTILLRLIFIFLIFGFVATLCFAGSSGLQDGGMIYRAGILIFTVQIIAFVPAYILKTEHFYDLTGGITYLLIVAFMSLEHQQLYGDWSVRSLIMSAAVSLWAIRLSSFLFLRVKKAGKDGRFDEIKTSFSRFLLAWCLQGLWVFMCTYPVLITLAAPSVKEGVFLGLGTLLWAIGWAIEVIADKQKSAFNKQVQNKGKFIDVGLWKKSRHPNYFGEFLLWTGITIMGIPVYQDMQWMVLITPLFVYWLLNKVSGINMLEARADKKWGNDPSYKAYKESTPVFFPKIK